MEHYLPRVGKRAVDLGHGDLLRILDFLLKSMIHGKGGAERLDRGRCDPGLGLHKLECLL